MSDFIIRDATQADFEQMAVLHRDTIRHINARDYSEEAITAWSARPSPELYAKGVGRGRRWVAEMDGKVVGFTDHGLDGKFWGLYVHKDHIGEGIGKVLLSTNESSLMELGFTHVEIESTLTARPFYESQGYAYVRDDVALMDGVEVPIVILEKQL